MALRARAEPGYPPDLCAPGELARTGEMILRYIFGTQGQGLALGTTGTSLSLPSLLKEMPFRAKTLGSARSYFGVKVKGAVFPAPMRPPPPPTPVSPDNRRGQCQTPWRTLFCALRVIRFQRREQMDCIFLTFSRFQCANS